MPKEPMFSERCTAGESLFFNIGGSIAKYSGLITGIYGLINDMDMDKILFGGALYILGEIASSIPHINIANSIESKLEKIAKDKGEPK